MKHITRYFLKIRNAAVFFVPITIIALSLFLSPTTIMKETKYPLESTVTPKEISLEKSWERKNLTPVVDHNPGTSSRPFRNRPYRIANIQGTTKAYITLPGTENYPGSKVALLDTKTRTIETKIKVGIAPYGIASHPSGKWVVVTNRFSNFLSVINTENQTVEAEIPVPFYCDDLVFSKNGKMLFISNFWKNQVIVVDINVSNQKLTGKLRHLGFDRVDFFGSQKIKSEQWHVCEICGWRSKTETKCKQCGHKMVSQDIETIIHEKTGVGSILRASCGTTQCHMYRTAGFYAGNDKEESFRSAAIHSATLLASVISTKDGGWADGVDGRHHPKGVIFEDLENNSDYKRIADWIANGDEGPGIAVGNKPRDLLLSPDGSTLYVANTGSLDISVIDIKTMSETKRIFTRSPVNDLVWVDGRIIIATLGVGSGHPKQHDSGRESLDRNNPQTEFSIFRDKNTGKPLPLEQQVPLGEFDDIDGTAQEKFRDITNDLVILHPDADNVASYKTTRLFTRYTSDSFESMAGDTKGDVDKELMKVVGAFPEQIVNVKNRIYVSMSGTFEVQEWEVDRSEKTASHLHPLRIFKTEFKPGGISFANGHLIVLNQLSDSITFINLESGESTNISLREDAPEFPSNEFERGEFFVQTSIFSADQDQSCVHCHYRDTSDGKAWSVSQVMGQTRNGKERTGGSREIPDIRILTQKIPLFLEGILSIDEPLTMMMEHNPLIDFSEKTPVADLTDIFSDTTNQKSADSIVVATTAALKLNGINLSDLIKRREIFFETLSKKYFGTSYSFRDFQKFIGVYQAGASRLLPNPMDKNDLMVQIGKELFNSPKVGCAGCHPAPAFTDKINVYNQNKSFPPLVTPAKRDNIHTLISADRIDYLNGYIREWDKQDKGRVEEHEGFYVAPSLRGIWARPPRFLHHGHAVSLREVITTPKHIALRHFATERKDVSRPGNMETGLNELNGVPDIHGVTSHLSVWEIECLIKFIQSI
ncbi:MAG: hypothetical protein GXP22_01815 [Gammaproteobacteria bacterium]|nr:hypothetical protein [Gammaproteobacteria bacterium]